MEHIIAQNSFLGNISKGYVSHDDVESTYLLPNIILNWHEVHSDPGVNIFRLTVNISVHFSVERISSIDYLILKKLVIIKLLVNL